MNIEQQLSEKIWDLYQTHGVPLEASFDILTEKDLNWDQTYLDNLIKKHQETSQSIQKGDFKAGVGIATPKTKALHTTTHLLHRILKDLLGDEIHQIGSNITENKAKFDINVSSDKINQELILEIESRVNQLIKKNLDMVSIETTPKEARKMGAIGLFGEKYGDRVKVYTLMDKHGNVYSREFCSGPHTENTSNIESFEVIKKKSIGNGQTRIEFNVILK